MGDVLMRGKLLSVVERDGVHEVADRLEATHGCLLCCAGGCTGQLGDFGQLGFALDQREQAAFVPIILASAAWKLVEARSQN